MLRPHDLFRGINGLLQFANVFVKMFLYKITWSLNVNLSDFSPLLPSRLHIFSIHCFLSVVGYLNDECDECTVFVRLPHTLKRPNKEI